MPTETAETLASVFCDVLAKMAFMFGDVADAAELAAPDGELLRTDVEFRGEHSGSLRLAAPAALGPSLAANVLGLDEGDAQAALRAHDALGELLNVTAGHLMTVLAGERAVVDLTAPVTSELTPAEWNTLRAAPGAVGLLVEGQPLLLRLER